MVGGTDVAVASEVLQQLDLAEGALGQDLLAEDVCDFLDGDLLFRIVASLCCAGVVSVSQAPCITA